MGSGSESVEVGVAESAAGDCAVDAPGPEANISGTTTGGVLGLGVQAVKAKTMASGTARILHRMSALSPRELEISGW